MYFCCSPNFSGKKSNEIIQGSLSSIKHAATSITRKFDEIKGAISANTTPVKSSLSIQGYNDNGVSEEDVIAHEDGTLKIRRVSSDLEHPWSRLSESRKSSYNNLVPLGENTSTMNLNSALLALPENLYGTPQDVSQALKFVYFKTIAFIFFFFFFELQRIWTIPVIMMF